MPEQQRGPIRALFAGLAKQGRKPPRLPVAPDSSQGHLQCCDLSLVPSLKTDGISEQRLPWDQFRCAPLVVEVWNQEDWVIPFGCSSEGIWEKCFHELSKSTKTVVIVDPYVMDPSGKPTGALTHFMQRLDEVNVAASYAVDIHTTTDQGVGIGDKLRENLSNLHVRGAVSVYMYSPTWPRTFPRDRWIRIDDVVFKWHGIDTLINHVPGDSCDKQQKHATRDLVDLVRELESTAPTIFRV